MEFRPVEDKQQSGFDPLANVFSELQSRAAEIAAEKAKEEAARLQAERDARDYRLAVQAMRERLTPLFENIAAKLQELNFKATVDMTAGRPEALPKVGLVGDHLISLQYTSPRPPSQGVAPRNPHIVLMHIRALRKVQLYWSAGAKGSRTMHYAILGPWSFEVFTPETAAIVMAEAMKLADSSPLRG
jgi:hypothetical protein